MTLVVNLYGGPGSGKSTTAARLFSELKLAGHDAELAAEYAKDLTWEERFPTLAFQPYVTATQMYRVHRLLGKVDVVITDSPILLANVYRGHGWNHSFGRWVCDMHHSWDTLDLMLTRQPTKFYSRKGRTQTEHEARGLDRTIRGVLVGLGIKFEDVPGPPAPFEPIFERVARELPPKGS